MKPVSVGIEYEEYRQIQVKKLTQDEIYIKKAKRCKFDCL